VHNERCTPGSGAGLVETTEGNFGMAPRPHVHVREQNSEICSPPRPSRTTAFASKRRFVQPALRFSKPRQNSHFHRAPTTRRSRLRKIAKHSLRQLRRENVLNAMFSHGLIF